MEASSLWRNSFVGGESDAASRLVESLRRMRKHAADLTSRIAASLPGLTIHDITHLDAIWDVAGIIAGEKFRLNPLEAYVFGGAVLLHDAGLCFEAYAGGQAAVRDTVQWRDARARLASIGQSDDLDADADFEALRTLHASQAEQLAVDPWRSDEGEEVFFICDEELREHYGILIGKIAASHHWDIEDVARKFQERRPAAPFLDSGWTVDPLTIACLLRVADAGHIDGTRAPSFLLKILQMNDVSRDHWVAQNHLGRLRVMEDDPTQLIVSSMAPFARSESSAWWVTYDAICLLDRELRDSNELLENAPDGKRAAFAARRVAGAGKVRETARFVQTDGWEPTDSSVHVSDVAALVSKLGGEQLYGKEADRLEIGLRELVQNAADAVMARRAVSEDEYEGQVLVRLMKDQSGTYRLQVDDDGLGMSQETLARDLLDFGRCFWTSERAAREFPGIHASGYSSIGRFGIGFFSVFMAAKRATVFSRRFDAGLDQVRCLSFERGVSLRPILSALRPADMGMSVSTRVELELKTDVIVDADRLRIRNNALHQEDLEVTFRDYVGALVCGLGVPVSVEWVGLRQEVHQGFPPPPTGRGDWLRRLSFVAAGVNQGAVAEIDSYLGRLTEIRDGQQCYGLAAIRCSPPSPGYFLSAQSVGGLATPHRAQQNKAFVGLMDHLPDGAQRNIGEITAPKSCIRAWLYEQVRILNEAEISPVASIYASYALMDFDFDPIEVLQGILVVAGDRTEFWRLEDIYQLIARGRRLLFPTISLGKTIIDPYNQHAERPSDAVVCHAPRNGTFNVAELAGDKPMLDSTLIGVVHRVMTKAGAKPRWVVHEKVYREVFDVGDYLEVIVV